MLQPRFSTVLALICIGSWACPAGNPAKDNKTSAPATAASKPVTKSGPASRPATAAQQPGQSASQPAVTPDPISGLVKLAEGLNASDIKPTDVLFVMARQAMAPGQAGRLVAVRRFTGMKFPLRYDLSAKNLMMPGVPFSGPFIVRARLDRDGDPMTKGADDLYAEFAKNVANGDEAIHLVLAKRPAAAIPVPSKKAPPKAPASAPASRPSK